MNGAGRKSSSPLSGIVEGGLRSEGNIAHGKCTGYDKDRKQFFAQLQRKDIPVLEQRIQNLMQQQQSRDFEIER